MIETETPERTEQTVEQLTRIHDFCRRGGVDAKPVLPQVEHVLASAKELKEKAAAAGLNSRERRVLSDALGGAVRETLS